MAAETNPAKMFVDMVIRPVMGFGFVTVGYLKMVRAITRSILLPSTVIGRNKQFLEQCVKQYQVRFKKVRLGARGHLDCAVMFGEAAKHDKGWIVYANANGVCYEHVLKYTEFLGKFFQRKVLVFNYSGVGYSGGMTEGTKDMVRDMKLALEYAFERIEDKTKETVLIWGHSIGGAVAMLAASEFHKQDDVPKLFLVLDRSFGHLEDVVQEKIAIGPLAPLISGLLVSSLAIALTLASLIGFGTHPWFSAAKLDVDSKNLVDVARAVLSGASLALVSARLGSERAWLLPFSVGFFGQIVLGNYWLKDVYDLDSAPVLVFQTFAIAFELGVRGVFNPLLIKLVSAQGWTMNPKKTLRSIEENGKIARIVVTFHEEDEMISPQHSIRMALPYANCHVVQLDGPEVPSSNHMYDLNLHELERIKDLLGV